MSDAFDIGILAESFAEYLSTEWPREKAVAYARGGATHADALWTETAALGWPALTLPEAHGGLGLGTNALAALHEALGAAAVPLPMLGTSLAAALITKAGSDAQQARLLPGLANGTERAAFAHPDAAVLNANGPTVSGVVADLLDVASATMLILRAMRGSDPVWLALPIATPGIAIARVALADTTRSLGTVTLTNVALDDSTILSPANAAALDNELLRLAAISLAADALGGGNAVLASTVEYMKVREQFGRVIGSFQALKHRAADHKAALESARELVDHAAGLAEDAPDALLAALTAKQHITRVTAEVARDCIQLHGGVGFTSEYVPHIYLKRAKLNEALFGTRSALLDRIADLLEAA
jgi:alkylation response protein AidB-like acyl-CoA dehydrogenase